jgi:hypothetical protein
MEPAKERRGEEVKKVKNFFLRRKSACIQASLPWSFISDCSN